MRDGIVLGAGFQGVSVALALAAAGYRVTLVDRAPDCLLRASLRNEGKIHLGFVYANDPSLRTSSLMLEGALAFGPRLEALLGLPVRWSDLVAHPFMYVVMRDSLVAPDRILHTWDRLQGVYEDACRTGDAAPYLGTRPSRLWRETSSTTGVRASFGDEAALTVETAELAIDPARLRDLVRARLIGAERVSCRFGHDVRGVERTSRGFRVEGTTADGHRWVDEASVVVNCLWDGRLAIDRLLGLTPARPWVYRLKYRVLARLPARLAALPSLTLVLGRYGDLVNYGDGRVYLSWYPTCLRGWSSDVEVPACWHRHRGGDVVGPEADAVARDTLAAFDRIVPGLAACRVESVAAGVIFSWGETDIDNPQSELHRRHDIGPEIFDGYVTVNTGKLTMAPLFAGRVVDLLR